MDNPLCSLIEGHLAPQRLVPHRACRQEAGVTLKSRAVLQQSLEDGGLRASSQTRLSEWGQVRSPRVRTGAPKRRPGGPSGAEAVRRLHGGGPTLLQRWLINLFC